MASVVSARTVVAVPIDKAWRLLRNLELAHRYVPGVTACRLTSKQREGIGATRLVEQKGRPPLQETVVDWSDGRGFVLKLHRPDSEEPPPPFAEARFTYALAAEGSRTRVDLALAYALRGGRLGGLLDTLVVRSASQRRLDLLADNLRTFYESAPR
jgi:hypothetical protein